MGDTLSMSLGAADFRLHRQARVQRTPSARQMVLDGWMDDHVTDDPGTVCFTVLNLWSDRTNCGITVFVRYSIPLDLI